MYYILYRNDEVTVIGPVPEGQDPLYGYGSYNLFNGIPYTTREEAAIIADSLSLSDLPS